MINEFLTFQKFNYYSYQLSFKSNKKIIANCDKCGKERIIIKKDCAPLCISCSAKKRGFTHKTNCQCPFCNNSGINNPFYGKQHTEKNKEKRRGKNSNFYIDGRTNKINFCIKEKCNNKISRGSKSRLCKPCSKKGKLNPNYKNGITSLNISIRNLIKYNLWRITIFKRDNYTCQECNKNKSYLEAHHIKPFNIILSEFLQAYSQFSPIENKEKLVRLAESYEPFWDIGNGITLCKNCHNNTKNQLIKFLSIKEK